MNARNIDEVISMKRWIVLLIALGVMTSCQGKLREEWPVERLTPESVASLIKVLPSILAFSQSYYEALPAEQRDTYQAYLGYMNALEKDAGMRKAAKDSGFETSEDMVITYYNLNMAYTAIKTEMTNFETDIKQIEIQLEASRSNVASYAKSTNQGASDQMEALRLQLKENTDRYENLLLVFDSLSNIDRAAEGGY